MHECCRFLNHLLAGCIWSCASFCWCSFQSVFFPSDLCRSSASTVRHCVHMHQHQQWFTVKEFSVWNNDDDTRIICGSEVQFMFGNAFLQSHCLWAYIRWQTWANAHCTGTLTHIFNFSPAFQIWCVLHQARQMIRLQEPPYMSVYEFYLKIVMINCYLFPSIIELWCLSEWDSSGSTAMKSGKNAVVNFNGFFSHRIICVWIVSSMHFFRSINFGVLKCSAIAIGDMAWMMAADIDRIL